MSFTKDGWTKLAAGNWRVTLEWTDALASGDSVTGSPTITAPPGISLAHISTSANVSTFRLSGGEAGKKYQVFITIQTNGGDTLSADPLVYVKPKDLDAIQPA